VENYYGEDNQPKKQAAASKSPFAVDDEEEKKQEQAAAAGQQVAAGQRPGAAPQAQPSTAGVAETFDVFGNKVGGTSVKVHAPPGGHSSITF
jgi:hypothetical protein